MFCEYVDYKTSIKMLQPTSSIAEPACQLQLPWHSHDKWWLQLILLNSENQTKVSEQKIMKQIK